jgi:hypothetical protein
MVGLSFHDDSVLHENACGGRTTEPNSDNQILKIWRSSAWLAVTKLDQENGRDKARPSVKP